MLIRSGPSGGVPMEVVLPLQWALLLATGELN